MTEGQADCELHLLSFSNALHHTPALDLRATHTWEGLLLLGTAQICWAAGIYCLAQGHTNCDC